MRNGWIFYSSLVLITMGGAWGYWQLRDHGIYQRFLNDVASVTVYPFLVVQQRIVEPINQWFAHRYALQELLRKHDQLKQKNDELYARIIELQASLKYGEDTHELRAFQQQYQMDQALIAQIMIRHFGDREHYLLIDRGSLHGVKPSMVAIYRNCLVGKITDVYPLYSKVVLITDVACKVAAYCAKTRATGIHGGISSLEATVLERVNHLSSVMQNDLVISSGEGLIFPQGFALGHVASSQMEGLYHKIQVLPQLNFHEIAYCMVLEKSAVGSFNNGTQDRSVALQS